MVNVGDEFMHTHTNSLARAQSHDEHMDDVSLHTYTYILTYIHKYSNFFVGVISVGLASACPKYKNFFK